MVVSMVVVGWRIAWIIRGLERWVIAWVGRRLGCVRLVVIKTGIGRSLTVGLAIGAPVGLTIRVPVGLTIWTSVGLTIMASEGLAVRTAITGLHH